MGVSELCHEPGCDQPRGDQSYWCPKHRILGAPGGKATEGLERFLRLRLAADVGGWDVDEVHADSHRELFVQYAAELRKDAASHQATVNRLLQLAAYVDVLAAVPEP